MDDSRNPPQSKQDLLTAVAGLIAEAVAQRLVASGPTGPRMISIRESRVPYRVLLRAISAGEIPAYRVGRATYIAREDEDEWISRAEHRVRPGETQPEAEPDEIGELIAISGRCSR